VKRAALVALLALALPAESGSWLLLASDDLNATYLDTSSLSRNAAGEVLFRINVAYKRKRDMMGLFYDSATKDYTLSCETRLIVSMQHLLWDRGEIVWTFPLATERLRAEQELAAELLSRVCE
jgi:hypothetical protein